MSEHTVKKDAGPVCHNWTPSDRDPWCIYCGFERVLHAPISPADVWDEALASVARGVEAARKAHADHGHRAVVSSLIGLERAIPRTENPYREAGR